MRASCLQPHEFRAAREALGLTQADLGKALESDTRTVQRWEAGERAVPGPVRVALRCMARLQALGIKDHAA